MILLYVLVIARSLSPAWAHFYPSFYSKFAISEDHTQSLFGYSISYQENIQSLIASAPTDDFLGKIYKCDVQVMNGNCTMIPTKNKIIKDTTHYWLGASVASGPSVTVTCAPRYLKRIPLFLTYSTRIREGTFGQCFILDGNNLSQMPEITPQNRDKAAGNFEQTTDATGWSTIVTEHGVAIVGSPAMISGRVLIYEKPRSYGKKDLNPEMVYGKVGSNRKYDVKHNFGYSLASGNFTGAEELYAIGSTYGLKGEGKVVFISTKLTNYYHMKESLDNTVTGVGSMFAAYLCAGHFRGIKTQTDLVVGAPAMAEQSNQYDVGAIVFYYFDKTRVKPEFTEGKVIKGFKSGSRFGAAMVNLGDINGDEKDDLAVAAPYEDDHGVVYIYSGSDINSENNVKYLHRIPAGSMQAFGLSLAVVKREFGCDDLAIGAPVSERVVLVQCIPHIVITSMSVKHSNLTIRKNDTFFEFKSCVQIKYPRPLQNISAKLQITVQITHKSARLEKSPDAPFLYNVTLLVNQNKYCETIVVLTPKDGDYSEVIQYEITLKHVDDALQLDNHHPARVTVSKVQPIRGTLWAAMKCKNFGMCKPNLEPWVYSTLTENYTVGSTDKEQVTVYVRNIGETAYAACLNISIAGVGVLTVPGSCEGSDGTYTCRPLHPLYENDTWNTGAFDLETKGLTSSVQNIIVNVNTKCYEKADETKLPSREFKLTYDTNVTITGLTNRGSEVKITKYEIDEAGKELQHIYTIVNNGVTTWTDLKFNIEVMNAPYLTYSDIKVVMEQEDAYCLFKDSMFTCDLPLRPMDVMEIFVPFLIKGGGLDSLLDNKNVTVNSALTVNFHEVNVTHSISTLLTLDNAATPWWIIALAVLLGCLLLVVIGYILYQRGLLRSKKKVLLRRAQRSVRRQTIIRNSFRHSELRESFRRESAVDAPEEIGFKTE